MVWRCAAHPTPEVGHISIRFYRNVMLDLLLLHNEPAALYAFMRQHDKMLYHPWPVAPSPAMLDQFVSAQ